MVNHQNMVRPKRTQSNQRNMVAHQNRLDPKEPRSPRRTRLNQRSTVTPAEPSPCHVARGVKRDPQPLTDGSMPPPLWDNGHVPLPFHKTLEVQSSFPLGVERRPQRAESEGTQSPSRTLSIQRNTFTHQNTVDPKEHSRSRRT